MTRKPSLVLTILTSISLFLIPASHAVRVHESVPKFLPPEDKVLFIVGQDRHAIENYIEEVGVVPAGFTFYTSIQKMDGLSKQSDYGGGQQHASYLLDRYPFEVVQIGLYMVGALDPVIAGTYDKNIRRLGDWINSSEKLVYLRIGYEFDNPDNKYTPAKYIAAYRYIVDKLQSMGVKNVAYVWHSYASTSRHPFSEWYPGDAYVDWIGITYFNPYNTDNMDQVVEFAASKKKPVMIAESAPIKMGTIEGEALWQRWYEFVFDYIKTRDIKAFCYINCNWDKLPMFTKEQWGDSRIEADKVVKSKWIKTIQDEKFINHSLHLREFASQAKIQP